MRLEVRTVITEVDRQFTMIIHNVFFTVVCLEMGDVPPYTAPSRFPVASQDADVVDAKLPRVAFFANRNIAAGEDLGRTRNGWFINHP